MDKLRPWIDDIEIGEQWRQQREREIMRRHGEGKRQHEKKKNKDKMIKKEDNIRK